MELAFELLEHPNEPPTEHLRPTPAPAPAPAPPHASKATQATTAHAQNAKSLYSYAPPTARSSTDVLRGRSRSQQTLKGPKSSNCCCCSCCCCCCCCCSIGRVIRASPLLLGVLLVMRAVECGCEESAAKFVGTAFAIAALLLVVVQLFLSHTGRECRFVSLTACELMLGAFSLASLSIHYYSRPLISPQHTIHGPPSEYKLAHYKRYDASRNDAETAREGPNEYRQREKNEYGLPERHIVQESDVEPESHSPGQWAGPLALFGALFLTALAIAYLLCYPYKCPCGGNHQHDRDRHGYSSESDVEFEAGGPKVTGDPPPSYSPFPKAKQPSRPHRDKEHSTVGISIHSANRNGPQSLNIADTRGRTSEAQNERVKVDGWENPKWTYSQVINADSSIINAGSTRGLGAMTADSTHNI